MDNSSVRFPVRCPVCGNEVLAAVPVMDLVGALINELKIQLYAICHDAHWSASVIELQQLREYVGAVWLDKHRGQESAILFS